MPVRPNINPKAANLLCISVAAAAAAVHRVIKAVII